MIDMTIQLLRDDVTNLRAQVYDVIIIVLYRCVNYQTHIGV